MPVTAYIIVRIPVQRSPKCGRTESSLGRELGEESNTRHPRLVVQHLLDL